jgi:hypothetical protein
MLLDPSVTLVGDDPTQLDVRAEVVDARGTGVGRRLSMTAAGPGSALSSSRLVVASANAACRPGSACTVPVNGIAYPLTVTLSGTRSMMFEAEPSSGMGAPPVDFHVYLAGAVPSGLSLSFSLATPPSALSVAGP